MTYKSDSNSVQSLGADGAMLRRLPGK